MESNQQHVQEIIKDSHGPSATLVFPIKNGRQVLLATKTRRVGEGLLNGFGGRPHINETGIRACACRELFEESIVYAIPSALKFCGIIHFFSPENRSPKNPTQSVFIYTVQTFMNEPISTEEMINPTWYDIDDLPFGQMLPADREFLPLILRGEFVNMKIRYLRNGKYLFKRIT